MLKANQNINIFSKILQGIFFAFAFSVFVPYTQAAVLLPGNINTCGELASAGTYTLTSSVSNVSGLCFQITSNNVIIDGAGFTVTATTSSSAYAVVATSSVAGGSAYGPTTIKNITFSGFGGGGVLANGNAAPIAYSSIPGGAGGNINLENAILGAINIIGGAGDDYGFNEDGDTPNGTSGSGGTLNATSSTIGTISTLSGATNGFQAVVYGVNGTINLNNSTTTSISNGGDVNVLNSSVVSGALTAAGNVTVSTSTVSGALSAATNSGIQTATVNNSTVGNINANAIYISAVNVDISNKTYSTNVFSVSYSGTLTTTSVTLSALTNIIVNGTDFGPYTGGGWPNLPNVGFNAVTSCRSFDFIATYTLTQNITDVSGTCFVVRASGVTIDGAGFTVTATTGNSAYAVTATTTGNGTSGYSTTTIQNIIFSGFGGGVNASGNDSTTATGGNGGGFIISSSTIGTLLSNGGKGRNGTNTNAPARIGGTGGVGGNIVINGNSNIGAVNANGGLGGNAFSNTSRRGAGGLGGTITLQAPAITGNLNAKGGDKGSSGSNSIAAGGGSGGTITITGSDPDISNIALSVAKGSNQGTPTNPTPVEGSINITYTNSLTTTNTTISALGSISLNGNSASSLLAGSFPHYQTGSISTCAAVVGSGTYTLSQDITDARSGTGISCLPIYADNVVIDGAGYSLNAVNTAAIDGSSLAVSTTTIRNITITAGNFNRLNSNKASNPTTFVISTSTISGTVASYSNEGGGTFIINNSNLVDIQATGGNVLPNAKPGGYVSVYNSTVTGTINVTGSLAQDLSETPGIYGGNGGTVYISSSTVQSIINNGGEGGDSQNCGEECNSGAIAGSGGNAGTTTVVANSVILGNIENIGGTTGTGLFSSSISGGNGGYVSIENSSTTNVYVDGGSTYAYGNGGDGGTITLTTATSTDLYARGGNVTVGAGEGGSGGTINISTDSVYASFNVDPGTDGDTFNSTVTKRSGTRTSFAPPVRVVTNSNVSSVITPAAGTANSFFRELFKQSLLPSISFKPIQNFTPFSPSFTPGKIGATILGVPFRSLNPPIEIAFVKLPTNLISNIKSFIYSPVPESIQKILDGKPNVANLIASVGVTGVQGIASLGVNPVEIGLDNIDEGVFKVFSGGTAIKTYVTYDKAVGGFAQLIKVSPSQTLSIKLKSNDPKATEASYLNETIKLSIDEDIKSASIVTPNKGGRYVFAVNNPSLPLLIDVIEPPKPTPPQKQSIFSWLWKWIK